MAVEASPASPPIAYTHRATALVRPATAPGARLASTISVPTDQGNRFSAGFRTDRPAYRAYVPSELVTTTRHTASLNASAGTTTSMRVPVAVVTVASTVVSRPS